MNWFFLFLAGVFEVIWAVCLKYCNGFKPTLILFTTISASLLSMIFLGLSIRTIPMGTAYAIWSGIGVVGIAAYGIIFLGESLDPLRIFFLFMVFVGAVGLKIT
jgi:quaternary ammonium compound-resistance protein SugE